jgi:hypothetical protein
MDNSASRLAPLLFSNGPASDRADKMGLYGWLIGAWTMDAVMHAPNGETHERPGEIGFAWVLQGRAIQDVWILPDFFYGTTLRVYDPGIVSTRFDLHRHLAKSLRSTGQVVRLPHPVSLNGPPHCPMGKSRPANCDETRNGKDLGSARSLSSARAAPPGAEFHGHRCLLSAICQFARPEGSEFGSSRTCGCSKDRCVELRTHPRPT